MKVNYIIAGMIPPRIISQTVGSTFNTYTGSEPEFPSDFTQPQLHGNQICTFKSWKFLGPFADRINSTDVNPGGSHTITHDTDVYPNFDSRDAVKYSITIDGNDVGSQYELSYYKIPTQIPYKESQRFMYYLDQDMNILNPNDEVKITKDLVLTSQWEDIEYTIIYKYGSQVITRTTTDLHYTIEDVGFTKPGHHLEYYEYLNNLRIDVGTEITLHSNLELIPVFYEDNNQYNITDEEPIETRDQIYEEL